MVYLENKKGWIRIVEAFVSILLIVGTLLILINQGYLGGENLSKKVYDVQTGILTEIQQDNTLRLKVLNAMDSTPPIEISSHDETETLNLGSGDGEFPTEVWDRIEDRLTKDFGYLECRAKICELQNICAFRYAKSFVLIRRFWFVTHIS